MMRVRCQVSGVGGQVSGDSQTLFVLPKVVDSRPLSTAYRLPST